MQGSRGDTDVENRLLASAEECERNGESGINICTLSGVRWMACEKLLCSTGSPVWCSMMTWRDVMEGGEEGQGGRGYVYNYG